MNKLPTAEEFWKQNYDKNDKVFAFGASQVMIEFAKLHVEAALKSASEYASMRIEETNTSVRYLSYSKGDKTLIIDKDSILTAYPLENIK